MTPFSTTLTIPASSRLALITKPSEMGQSESSTIVRSFLNLGVKAESSVNTAFRAFSCGLVVVSDNAASVGVTALPSPALDDADWLLFYQGHVPPYGGVDDCRDCVHHIDSKAMRKVHGEGKSLAFVISNLSTIVSLEYSLTSRILFKLA